MKAAVLEELGKIVVREVPDPTIDDHSALLRVEAVAVCGSDIRIFRHGNPRVKPPAIIGHEIAGTVVAAGKDVTRGQSGPAGRRGGRRSLRPVRLVPRRPGQQLCDQLCRRLPDSRRVRRVHEADAAACLAEGPVTPFAESLDFGTAALAEPLACAINGLELVGLSLGKTVVLVGMGPIGCMMIDLARVMGATKVICVQRSKPRMEIARRYEADVYIDSAEEDVVARCRAETGGEGPDIVVTTCGSVEVHEQAIEMVAHRGYVNLFGGLGKNVRPMSVLSNTIHYKECFVTGSHGCVPRHHAVGRQAAGTRAGAHGADRHPSFPAGRINEAFDTMENRGGMKIIVHPHG